MSTSSAVVPAAEEGGNEGAEREPLPAFDQDSGAEAGEPPTSPPSPPPGFVLRRGALASVLVAALLTLVLEASTLWYGDPRWLLDQFGFTGIAFYLDTLVMWLAVLLLWSVTGRLWWSVGLLSAVVLPVAAANRVKISLREEPIYPSDVDFLRQPGFLGSMVGAS